MTDTIQSQIDPVAKAGDPGTVTLPVTGHVLSVPKPEAGETITGYYVRVSKQTGGLPSDAFALAQAGNTPYGLDVTNPANWPTICDELANRVAYMTPQQKADLTKDTYSGWTGTGSIPTSSLTQADMFYIANAISANDGDSSIATAVLSGTGLEVAGAVSAGAAGNTGVLPDGRLVNAGGVVSDNSVTPAVKAAVDAQVAKVQAAKAAKHVDDTARLQALAQAHPHLATLLARFNPAAAAKLAAAAAAPVAAPAAAAAPAGHGQGRHEAKNQA